MQQDWRYFLAEQPAPGTDPTLPLARIAWLRQARDRTLGVALNRSGDAGFKYPASEKRWAGHLFDPTLCIVAERNGVEMWSGPLANNNGQATTGKWGDITVKAVGWMDLLGLRELREDVAYSTTNNYIPQGAAWGSGTTPPAGVDPATGTSWTDADIVRDLLQKVINYDTAHAPPIRWGAAYGTRYTRQVSWPKGTKLLDALRLLMDVESGIDIKVDTSRRLNVYSWDSYADHPEIVYGFNKPPFNCENFSWSLDMMAIRNRMPITGDGGASALAEDTGSQNLYGLREETVNLPGINDAGILLYYGGEEVALKAFGNIFYTFVPKSQKKNMPVLGESFDIGDALRFSVDFGPIQEDQRSVRAFAANLSISNEGIEKITSLSTLASQAS